MTLPNATTRETDGTIGALPTTTGGPLAVVGASSSGPLNLPALFTRAEDVASFFGDGPMPELAAYYTQKKGFPVIAVRTATTVAGTVSSVTQTGTGTSDVTVTASPAPIDDYDILVVIVTGGTRGTAGITYQYSLDEGRTLSAVQALGTGIVIVIPGSGVSFDIGAGTLVAGDKFSVRCTAPQWNGPEVTAALAALRNVATDWEMVAVVGSVTGTTVMTIDAAVEAMASIGKYKAHISNTRLPTVGETEAAYLASLSADFSAVATTIGNVCAGACEIVSAISGRTYRRPILFAVAAQEASVAIQKNTARTVENRLSVAIAEGINPKHHDEALFPGLDDARFTTLRSWEGKAGTYITRSRCLAPQGSNYRLFTYRRVMNVARAVVRSFMIDNHVNRELELDPATGFISEAEAQFIEKGAEQALADVLLVAPSASGVRYRLNRNDNVLQTNTLMGKVGIVPLGYPEFIDTEIGFVRSLPETNA